MHSSGNHALGFQGCLFDQRSHDSLGERFLFQGHFFVLLLSWFPYQAFPSVSHCNGAEGPDANAFLQVAGASAEQFLLRRTPSLNCPAQRQPRAAVPQKAGSLGGTP